MAATSRHFHRQRRCAVSVFLRTFAISRAGVSSHIKEARVVDKTKIPTGLVVDRVWIPMFDSDPRRPIAYVGDRPRRIAGTVMIALSVALCGAVGVANSAVWVAFVPL